MMFGATPVTQENYGKILPYEVEKYYQEEIKAYTQEFLNHLYDEKNPVRFAQIQAEIKSKIDLLQFLIDQSQAFKALSQTSQG